MENAATDTLHVKDFRNVRHMPMALGDLDPAKYLYAMAEAHYRTHCRTDYRASITRGGKVIARVYFRDNGRILNICAENR